MANFYTKVRTNFFKVTDIEKFKEICSRILTEGYNETCYDFLDNDETSNIVSIGFDGPFSYRLSDEEDDFAEDSYDVFNDLQEILAEGECIIFTEIGWEKLNCVTASSAIITKGDVQWIGLNSAALEKARKMLDNPDYECIT